jgi:hypothetical protein
MQDPAAFFKQLMDITHLCIIIGYLGTVCIAWQSIEKQKRNYLTYASVICILLGAFGVLRVMNESDQTSNQLVKKSDKISELSLKLYSTSKQVVETQKGMMSSMYAFAKTMKNVEDKVDKGVKNKNISPEYGKKLKNEIKNAVVTLTGQGAQGLSGKVNANTNVSLPSLSLKATLNSPTVSGTSNEPKSAVVPLTGQGAHGDAKLPTDGGSEKH